jgi:hypothetical protein
MIYGELKVPEMTTINFYSHKKEYGWMSNFYESPITIDGNTYPTTEHYFQACKMTDNKDHNTILSCKTPHLAAKLGRTMKMRDNWNEMRISVMLKALLAKFHQHPNLFVLLVNTGNAKLVEHTTNDSYWGDGGTGIGCNMLGKLLEYVRYGSWITLYNLGYKLSYCTNGYKIFEKNDLPDYQLVVREHSDGTYHLSANYWTHNETIHFNSHDDDCWTHTMEEIKEYTR